MSQKGYRDPIAPTLAPPEERIRFRNEKVAALRERSGLSMDELAKEMGFKGQSSIQRYLSPTYDKGFRPELAARFKAALAGRGDPPISPNDLRVFDRWAETADGATIDMTHFAATHFDAGGTDEDYYKQLEALGVASQSRIASQMGQLRRSRMLDMDDSQRLAALPLAEGDVFLKLPKKLSAESAATLLDWVNHLISLAVNAPEK